MLDIENRSEQIMLAYLTPFLVGFATLNLSTGFSGNVVKHPSLAVICASMVEARLRSGIYRATMAVEIRTRLADDPSKTVISPIIDMVRTALQQFDIVAQLNMGSDVHTVHGVELAEAQTTIDHIDRVSVIAFDLLWSPTK